MTRYSVHWGMILVGIGIVLVTVIAVFRSTRTSETLEHRRQAMATAILALEGFRVHDGRYPPAVWRDELGRATCSWRLGIRGEIEQVTRPIEHLDVPWYTPENMGWVTNSYGRYYTRTNNVQNASGLVTHIVAVTGPGTAFGTPEVRETRVPKDLILLVETKDLAIVWSEPGDINVDTVSLSITHGPDGDGFFVAFADGTIWYLNSRVPLDRLKGFFTIAGARRHDRNRSLLPYREDVP